MNIPIWPGSSSFAAVSNSWYISGSQPKPTSFGFYDGDADFKIDADKVADFCASMLGYPMVDIELQDINFYKAFEKAITVYGNELYSFLVRDNILSLNGLPTSSNLNNATVNSNLSLIISLAEQYGAEVGVGGDVTWYSGSVILQSGVQDYNLNEWAVSNSISASNLEIKRVFYQSKPAVTRFFDPYAGTGMGMLNLLDSFGWGSYSPAINFLLMPLNYDLQIIQSIEFNDTIRKSHYSFELINNNLRIFPIPNTSDEGTRLWFQYILKSERISNSIVQQSGNITNVSNVPYTNPIYSQINPIGRAWIFEYALAISKGMLANVRGKYQVVEIPDDSVTLNHQELLNQSLEEQKTLIEKLRIYLDETSRKSLLERKSAENEFLNKELNNIPNLIYLG